MRMLLIFCYFSLLMLGYSCGESSEKTTNANTTDTTDSTEVVNTNKKSILFFGDSLTAGLGLDTSEAFPAIIQNRIDSLGLAYQVINAGLSGETTASGRNRISWVLNQKVDVFVLGLGANDGLRGIPISETRKNLQAIIDFAKEKNPDVQIILAGMQIPPNMGQDYTNDFKNIFPEIAKDNSISLVPFLLENVGGIPELNQQDGIHPTAEGHKLITENVWPVIKDLL